MAAKNGINKMNVYQRVHVYGWEIERAITVPIKNHKNRSRGKMLTTAEQNGISKTTYYQRIKTGMDPYEAATKSKGHTEYLRLARKNGIKDVTFYQRITRGMKPYEAATKPAASRNKVQQIS
ncbi:hypothetical protein JDS87_23885 [Bacillus cereus]|nr:hypothetical protein [Bacillus cereus]